MPEIESFKGLLYNSTIVDIAKVVTPPYDVISEEQQNFFYQASQHNIIRLILGETHPKDTPQTNQYTRAKDYLNKWQSENIIIQDNQDCIYYLEEDFLINGIQKKRKGFIARTKLEDFKDGNILPHEKTMSGPKEDRLKLTKACKCNFSQIFAVYSDENGKSISMLKNSHSFTPIITTTFDNINYKLYQITDPSIIAQLKLFMKDKKIFIADGHHRYETALAYRNYMREQSQSTGKLMHYDYVMMYFSPIEENDLLILPTHRGIKGVKINITSLISNLSQFFEIKEIIGTSDYTAILDQSDKENSSFILCIKDSRYLLKFSNIIKEKLSYLDKLDVKILQNFILDKFFGITDADLDSKNKIEYIKDIEHGLNLIADSKLDALFLMNPTKMEQVKNIALSGEKMPQKSTYFFPKLITGLVIYKLD